MNANAAGEGRPFLPEPCTWRTYGDMNVVLWRKQQETPLEEARGLLEESHNAVMALAEGFSDEELFHKGRFDWTGRTTLGSYLRERHELPLRLGAQKTARPQEELRTARWSEMRLSLGRIRGLSGCVVQNASESARIRPDPAQVAKLRRILDHPRAMPPERGETQTDFGPPHPQDASPSCGSGTPTPVVRWRSRDVVRWRFPRP